MKSEKIKMLIKVLIPVSIILMCFGIEKIIGIRTDKLFAKPVTINSDDLSLKDDNSVLEVVSKESFGDVKGLTNNFGFKNNNEILLGIGMSREEFYEKYPEELDKGNKENDKLIDEQYNDAYCGKMYEFNITDSTKKPLNINVRDVYSDLLAGGNRVSYVDNNKFYIYDLNTKSKNEYKDMRDKLGEDKRDYQIGPEYMGRWSKDGKCLIYYEDGNINIYNTLENTTKSFEVDSDNRDLGMTQSYYSDDGQDVYYIGVKYENNMTSQGILKLNSIDGDIEEVLLLPPTDYSSNDFSKQSQIHEGEYCVLESGKKIIFNGIIEGIAGTYIYDVEDNKFYNVVPHDVEDMSYCSDIWVSPDKSKIIYINLEDENGVKHMNLYAAKINGNSLIDRICIYKDINLCGEKVTWSPDSKKILFFTAN